MKDLIEAFTIFLKYDDSSHPTNCSHDQLTVCVDPALVSDVDKARLEELGFHASTDDENFYSFRFGSN